MEGSKSRCVGHRTKDDDWQQNGLSIRNVTSLTELTNVNEDGGSDIPH